MQSINGIIRHATKQVFDPCPGLKRTIAYITGSARSGTTWLADMVAQATGARIVFEPLHHNGPIHQSPHFQGAEDLSSPLATDIGAALSGRFKKGTVNTFQPGGIYFKRVVKDIRPGVVPAIRSVAPDLPILHIIRHPIEVAVSRAQLETQDNWWDTDQAIAELHAHSTSTGPIAELAARAVAALAADPHELTRHVVIWCVENAMVRTCGQNSLLLSLKYEDLLLDQNDAFASIETLLDVKINRARLTRPTATSFRGETGVRALGKWRQHIDTGTATRLLRITEQFDLADLYGVNPAVDFPAN